MKKILFITVIIMAVATSMSAYAKSVGLFTAVSGTVKVQSFYEEVSRQVKTGDIVNVSDVVYTLDDARAEITFHDGNIIRLASKTRLKVNKYVMKGSESNEVIKLLRGKIRNIVKVIYDTDFRIKKGRYEIHTPVAICGVRGTDFFVYHDQKVSGAVFVEGRGYAYSSDAPGEVVTLAAGQQMTARTAKEAPRVTPARSRDIERFRKATRSRVQKGKEQKETKAPPQKAAAKVSKQKQGQKSGVASKGASGSSKGSSGASGGKGGSSSSGGTGGGKGGGSSGGSSSGGSGGGHGGGGGHK